MNLLYKVIEVKRFIFLLIVFATTLFCYGTPTAQAAILWSNTPENSRITSSSFRFQANATGTIAQAKFYTYVNSGFGTVDETITYTLQNENQTVNYDCVASFVPREKGIVASSTLTAYADLRPLVIDFSGSQCTINTSQIYWLSPANSSKLSAGAGPDTQPLSNNVNLVISDSNSPLTAEITADQTYETRFTGLTVTGTSTIEIDANYLINLSEINTSVSQYNITNVRFTYGNTATSVNTLGIDILPLSSTGTAQLSLDSLSDGKYDLQVTFGNLGTPFNAIVPFPLSYMYTSFTISGGVLIATSSIEFYNNTNPPPVENVYEDCSLTKLGGCINNSFRFLFIPSQESYEEILSIRDQLRDRIPFVYLYDTAEIVNKVFDTTQAQTLDVELNLGFGNLTLIDEDMIANAPQASTIRALLSAFLWVSFALVAYRMALGVHDNKPV